MSLNGRAWPGTNVGTILLTSFLPIKPAVVTSALGSLGTTPMTSDADYYLLLLLLLLLHLLLLFILLLHDCYFYDCYFYDDDCDYDDYDDDDYYY